MSRQNVNENLKGIRLHLGLSAEAWAKLVGVSPTQVYITESGSQKVSDEYMDKIVAALGVTRERLVYGPSDSFVAWLKARGL